MLSSATPALAMFYSFSSKLVQACEMAFDSPEDLKDMIFLQRDQHTEFKLQHPKDAMKAIETAQKRTLLGGVVKEVSNTNNFLHYLFKGRDSR